MSFISITAVFLTLGVRALATPAPAPASVTTDDIISGEHIPQPAGHNGRRQDLCYRRLQRSLDENTIAKVRADQNEGVVLSVEPNCLVDGKVLAGFGTGSVATVLDGYNWASSRQIRFPVSTTASVLDETVIAADDLGVTTLFAPGVEVRSLGLGNGTTVYSGTSQAIPHVTGLIACFRVKDLLTPDEVFARVRELAVESVFRDLQGTANLLALNGVVSSLGTFLDGIEFYIYQPV
ncbi:subtilisin [Colletotrichum orchidophilum]|uniref:Subtilisin n=1 Tax=Colletotrichum orchidophilum TaxID=1209926 RepID=A0A1G4B4Q0_9PEZI|nr:subtilisin [Colletotrichum orchidophilum]OHE96418.1 subtilisin [Colletotrichum orchidophilum]